MTSFRLINTPDAPTGGEPAAHRVPAPEALAASQKPTEKIAHGSGDDDFSDLRVNALDHADIWAKYNSKAGSVQHVVPAPGE